MSDSIFRIIARKLFRAVFKHYRRDYGRYTILMKYFIPWAAPTSNDVFDIITMDDGIRLELNVREYNQGYFYLFNNYEPETVAFLQQQTKKGDYAFDIGANMGYMSQILSRAVGPNGKVFSFEPDPLNFVKLKKHNAMNNSNNVYPFQIALSKETGSLTLYHCIVDNSSSHSTIFYDARVSDTDTITVPAQTFDSFVQEQNIPKVDIIKIDVDGGEFNVIQGMKETLLNQKPIVILELFSEMLNISGMSVRTFKEYFLDNFDYVSYKLNQNGVLTESPISEYHHTDNVVFIHTSKKDTLVNVRK